MRASGAGNAQDAGFATCQQKNTPRAGHTRQSRADRVGKSALKAWPMLASARCLCSAPGAASPGGTLPTVEKSPAPAKLAGTSGKQWRRCMSVLTFPQTTHAPFTSAAGPPPPSSKARRSKTASIPNQRSHTPDTKKPPEGGCLLGRTAEKVQRFWRNLRSAAI